ncbi:MerR family transcriptional regulator [Methanococcus voltae]|uniref:Effector-binding domain-containing protein n=1 Tax=Methanococcus voltae TaxID=2188 RepID=A0A8J7RI47_METVO|nr:GyrI-like domain-containing protein [Methanococcus voltae]MBP2173049.1 effector-binding domain-containing protein [Methanococcus voltae]MBP2201895.1 effector-binding domain-containing protein [Methanococcus voltae]
MSRLKISIGQFSRMTNLTKRALRYYDEKGLLVPEKNIVTNYRYYTVDDFKKGIKINSLVKVGFNVEDVKNILEAEAQGNMGYVKAKLKERCNEVTEEITKLESIKRMLLNSDSILEVVKMTSEPVIKTIPQMRVISKREIGSYGTVCQKLIAELMHTIYSTENRKNDIKIMGPPMMLCYDGEYMEEGANIEMAIPVSGKIEISDEEMELKQLPKVEVISLIHKGPYENSSFSSSYAKIFEYAEKNDLKLVIPDREIYLNNPMDTLPENLETEIQYPFIREN